MFEQSYIPETPEVRTEPGDPFHNYEIKGWTFTPRLYKIFAASAIFNLLALFTIGEAELLTRRGCESQFVGRVCQVLDTVYVGSILFGTESEFADTDYTKTELQPGEEVIFIHTSGVEPPLSYPEGYFQIANPEQQFANVTEPGFLAPGIPANPTIGGSGLINTPPISPPVNPNPVQGDLPTGSPLGDANDNPTLPRNRKGRRGGQLPETVANANTDPNAANSNTANPTVPATEDVAKEDQFGVFINKRPMKDRA